MFAGITPCRCRWGTLLIGPAASFSRKLVNRRPTGRIFGEIAGGGTPQAEPSIPIFSPTGQVVPTSSWQSRAGQERNCFRVPRQNAGQRFLHRGRTVLSLDGTTVFRTTTGASPPCHGARVSLQRRWNVPRNRDLARAPKVLPPLDTGRLLEPRWISLGTQCDMGFFTEAPPRRNDTVGRI